MEKNGKDSGGKKNEKAVAEAVAMTHQRVGQLIEELEMLDTCPKVLKVAANSDSDFVPNWGHSAANLLC
jgi:hypothetical protein